MHLVKKKLLLLNNESYSQDAPFFVRTNKRNCLGFYWQGKNARRQTSLDQVRGSEESELI